MVYTLRFFLFKMQFCFIQGGSNITGTDFFKTIIAKHSLAHVSLQRTSLRSQHIFFQRSGSILMPFSKKACGWRRIHFRTVWMTASSGDHAVHSPRTLCPLWSTHTTQTHRSVRETLPHTVVGAFFGKGIRMLPERWEKMCWNRRGVRWRLTCASECLAIMVLKKKKSVPVIFEPPCNADVFGSCIIHILYTGCAKIK